MSSSNSKLAESEIGRSAKNTVKLKGNWEEKATKEWVDQVRVDMKLAVNRTWKLEFGGWPFETGFGESLTAYRP